MNLPVKYRPPVGTQVRRNSPHARQHVGKTGEVIESDWRGTVVKWSATSFSSYPYRNDLEVTE